MIIVTNDAFLCSSISIYFLMFGASIGPFFDISAAPLYVKEDRKTKFLLGKIHKLIIYYCYERDSIARLLLK